MSVRTMTLVWDLELPDSDKIVLLALADCANDEGHCWPSVASLVRKCSKSERTIQGCIKRLVDEGHLTRREVPGKGCNYTVHPRFPATAEIAPRRNCAPQGTTQTPAAAADKPSKNHQTEAKASYEVVGELWNELSVTSGISEIRMWNHSRKQMLNARVKEHGLEAILRGVRNIHASPFCRGQEGDGRKQDIGLLLQAKTCPRVLEGFYGMDQEKRELTAAEQIESLEKMIPRYEANHRPELAQQARDRIEALRRPVDPAVVASVAEMARGLAREKSVGRVAA